MKYFAIRKIGTYQFLPEVKRSYTHSEPSDSLPPRLFITKRAANNALTCWAQGKWTMEYSSYYDGDGDRYYRPDDTKRNRAEFMVVAVIMDIW
jgi:hypothetical protein